MAIDQSDISINRLDDEMKSNNNIRFVADNFIKTKYLKDDTFDYI